MKKRKKKPKDPYEQFVSTCGWCGGSIHPGQEVFGGGGKARPDFDISGLAGQILPVRLDTIGKTVLIGIAGLDSEAKSDGKDFVFMTCSEACAIKLRQAFQSAIDLSKQADWPES